MSSPHASSLLDSVLYKRLERTTFEYVSSTSFSPTVPLNPASFLSITTPTYTHTWGHRTFTSTRAALSRTLSRDDFLAQVVPTATKLESLEVEVEDVLIDVRQLRVVVRATYVVKPRGVYDEVRNDTMWILKISEAGTKVVSATEFVDADASEALTVLMVRAANVERKEKAARRASVEMVKRLSFDV